MLRLGLIGFAEGNGHPFSWGAIFNGYEPGKIAEFGFPNIEDYLSREHWPQCRIPLAQVVSVWTESKKKSEEIALAVRVPLVAESIQEMLDHVDAVLLARDDSENHLTFAKEVLARGFPIYIDKPIATKISDLDEIYSLERYSGQIFTCSALRYSRSLDIEENHAHELGPINEISAQVPNSWEKYAIHAIEPILKWLQYTAGPLSIEGVQLKSRGRILEVKWDENISFSVFCTGKKDTEISLTLVSGNAVEHLRFDDPFVSFRAALLDFVLGATSREVRSSKSFNYRVVSLIEAGIT